MARRLRATAGLSLVLLAAACGGGRPAPAGTPTPRVVTIAVQDNVFTPKVTTVAAGETVEWRWSGQNPHNVTGDDFAGPTQVSGVFDHRFGRPGTYLYRCTIHPHMLGEVVVR